VSLKGEDKGFLHDSGEDSGGYETLTRMKEYTSNIKSAIRTGPATEVKLKRKAHERGSVSLRNRNLILKAFGADLGDSCDWLKKDEVKRTVQFKRMRRMR
jgi:hypothetical protein